jgi:4-hydroxythreonine-4-phosphate dehydrogenase
MLRFLSPDGADDRAILPLAVTMGDPAGIGGELLLALWARRHIYPLPPFFVIDDPERLAALAAHLKIDVTLSVIKPSMLEELAMMPDDALAVLRCDLQNPAIPGKPDPGNAPAVMNSIETAVHLALSGLVSGIVTNPIAKSVLYQAGFKYPGHTEFLAWLCRDAHDIVPQPVMMLAAPMLRTVPVTVHQSLASVSASLNQAKIVEIGQIVDRALRKDFGIALPRLAIAGLNPHAGENGAMGLEDMTIIAPAVHELRQLGINATGPWAADTLFHEARRKEYDVVLAMYHDQALIPVKTLAFDQAVNVTLGLPILRTSPDHGTAFDLSGSGLGRPDSLYAALIMAAEMAHKALLVTQ